MYWPGGVRTARRSGLRGVPPTLLQQAPALVQYRPGSARMTAGDRAGTCVALPMAEDRAAGKDVARRAAAGPPVGQPLRDATRGRRMPPTHLPLVVRLGGIRSLLSFCAIMTAGLAAALSPMAVAMWEPALAAVTLLPALLGVGGIAYYLRRGLSVRRMAREARRAYSRVTYDYEVTELQARLVPEGEARSARVMADYRWLRDEYENLTRSWQDLGSPRGTQWFEPGMLGRVTELERRSAVLDLTENAIVGHAAFLTLSSHWERIWFDEQRPVLEDLDLLLDLCQWIDSCAFTPGGTVEARELVRAHHQRLSEMTAELTAGRLQPSVALDELSWIGADVRRSVNCLSLCAAGAEPSLGLPGAEVQGRRGIDGWPDTVGIAGGAGDGQWTDDDAVSHLGHVSHVSPRRHAATRSFLGDGSFPGY